MPTTNPVPSQDPSDLLFNAGKLDEVVNGTANSFTDRLGVARRTVAGMNADFDAQLADAESDLNVYRADAAASAAEALGYLQTIRATSYGAYASDPATDPLGNPPTVGDEYFNTTENLLKRWNGTTWQASDINTANLAAPSGSSLVGYLPAGTGAVATTEQAQLRRLPIFDENYAVVGGGASDDRVALQAAIVAAETSVSKTLVLTKPTYLVTTTSSNTGLVVSNNLRIVSECPGGSIIIFGPNNPTHVISGITFAGGKDFVLENVTLQAPLEYDQVGEAFPIFDAITQHRGILYQPGSSNATFKNVKTTGYWLSGILASGGATGNKTTRLEDCDIAGLNIAFGVYASSTPGLTVRSINSKYRGHSNQGSDWSGRGHCVYIHPNIAIDIQGGLMLNGGRQSLHHYSDSITYANLLAGQTNTPEFVNIKDVIFRQDRNIGLAQIAAMMTSNLGGSTYVENCVFDGTIGITTRNNTTLVNCKVLNGGSLGFPYQAGYYDYVDTVSYVNCDAVAGGAFGTIPAAVGSPSRIVNVSVVGGVYGDGITHAGDGLLTIDNARLLYSSPETGCISIQNSGPWVMRNCRVTGGGPFFIRELSSSARDGEIVGNRFDCSVYGNIKITSNPTDGENFTINDGTTAKTFEFDSNGSVTAGSVPITIAATLLETAKNAATAIKTAFAGVFRTAAFSSVSGPYASFYLNTEVSSSYTPAAVTKVGTSFGVSGLSRTNIFMTQRAEKTRGSENSFSNGCNIQLNTGYSNLQPKKGIAVDAIASTGSMYVPMSFDTFRITGTATINNLLFGFSGISHQCFNGASVKLISVDGFTLSAAGNIVPLSTSARAAGSVVSLVYDHASTKWREF